MRLNFGEKPVPRSRDRFQVMRCSYDHPGLSWFWGFCIGRTSKGASKLHNSNFDSRALTFQPLRVIPSYALNLILFLLVSRCMEWSTKKNWSQRERRQVSLGQMLQHCGSLPARAPKGSPELETRLGLCALVGPVSRSCLGEVSQSEPLRGFSEVTLQTPTVPWGLSGSIICPGLFLFIFVFPGLAEARVVYAGFVRGLARKLPVALVLS